MVTQTKSRLGLKYLQKKYNKYKYILIGGRDSTVVVIIVYLSDKKK